MIQQKKQFRDSLRDLDSQLRICHNKRAKLLYPNTFKGWCLYLLSIIWPRAANDLWQMFSEDEDSRYAAHVLMADSRLDADSEYHGGITQVSAVVLRDDLQAMIEGYPGMPLHYRLSIQRRIAQLDQYISCCNWATHIKLLNYPTDSESLTLAVNEYAFELLMKIYQLKPGQRILLPFGFSSQAGGHAALIEVTRTRQDDQYQVAYYNTGAGAEKAMGWINWSRSAFLGHELTEVPVRIAQVGLKALNGSSFLTDIIRAKAIDYPDIDSASEAMNKILSILPWQDAAQAQKLQVNGTCSTACLQAWNACRLPDRLIPYFNVFQIKRALEKVKHTLASPSVDAAKQQELRQIQRAGQKALAQAKAQLPSRKAISEARQSYRQLLASMSENQSTAPGVPLPTTELTTAPSLLGRVFGSFSSLFGRGSENLTSEQIKQRISACNWENRAQSTFK